MIKVIKSYIYLLAVASFVIVLDQWTKWLVRINLDFTDVWTPLAWAAPYFRIVHWQNTGAAFGMLQEFGGVFTILSILVSIVIIYYFPRVPQEDWPLRVAMGLQLGGALGNLVDRVTQGYVVDFISFFPNLNLPVFNIADLSITVGVIVLIVGIWLKEREQKKETPETASDTERVDGALSEEQWGE